MARKDFYALLVRLFLGYIFFSSGLCKLAGGEFGQLIGPPTLIDDLTPYGLRGFAIFVAFSQVMTGALILSQRYSLLGLVALMPINISILAVTISLHWQGTPYVNALLVLLNGLALLYEWDTLKVFLLPEAQPVDGPPRVNRLFPNQVLAILGIGLALITALTAHEYVSLTVIPASLCLLLVYRNILSNNSLFSLDKTVLVLSLLAMLLVTWAGALTTIGVNPPLGIVFILGLIFLLLALSMGKNWWERKRQINSHLQQPGRP